MIFCARWGAAAATRGMISIPKIPHSFFAPPGTVSVSATALALARDFDEDTRRVRSKDPWVLAFDWADSQIVRMPKGGPRHELGASLDLVAYEPADVSPDVLQTIDGLTFAVRIPNNIYERSRGRLIDVDDASPTRLVLR